MDNIIDIELTGRSTRRDQKLWQYDYGQVLRIAGKEFPKVTEVQFSLQQSGGHTLDRIGTSNNGLLTVQIPNELLQNKGATSDYTIYAFVYLSGDGYGNTKYMIQLPVESRPEPTDPSEDPSIDPSIFEDAINAVNASAERAETAEKSAKESADKAKEYAESAGKSKGDVEKARDNAISAIGIEKENALRGIESKTVESVQKIQIQAEASQNGIKQSISDATKKKTELDGAISNATDAKGNLDKAVQSAGNAKTELDTSIEKAGEAKTALDSSISYAGEKQLALDATVEQANTVDESLKEQIGSAEQIQANVEQIAKNKADISSLNEDLADLKDKKITKFYASNQGEKHLVDSDNGKIMDMMLYGQSEQKQYRGKNLLKIRDDTQTTRGVTVTAKDGVLSLKGTATGKGWALIGIDSFVLDGTYILSSNISTMDVGVANKSYENVMRQGKPATLKNAEVSKVHFTLEEGKTYDISNILVQIEKGSEATSYEPYVGGKPSPNPDYPQEIKRVVNPTVKITNEDGLKVQSLTLNNITLNAIPVASGGNVTINGQQYIADYVNVERGKLVKMVDSSKLDNTQSIVNKTEWLLAEPQEIDLTQEEVQKLKTLATYYPTTNIFISSEQLDGYTVFNYPISMANGWNYVKQQLNDNRDYIYDMDIQSAEAYVNSEYAVALTELEV